MTQNNWDGITYKVVEQNILEIARIVLAYSGGVKYVENDAIPNGARCRGSKEESL